MELKWYNKTWVVVLWCILFFPVGLYALWKNAIISKGWKIGVTAAIVLVIIGSAGNGKNAPEFDLKKEKETQLTHIAFFSEEALKAGLKDPGSYENISSDHSFMNDTLYKVEIVYTATNSFGGRIQNKYLKTGVLKYNPKDSTFTNTVKFEKSF